MLALRNCWKKVVAIWEFTVLLNFSECIYIFTMESFKKDFNKF